MIEITDPESATIFTVKPIPVPPVVVVTPFAVTYKVPPAPPLTLTTDPAPTSVSTVNPVPDPPVVATQKLKGNLCRQLINRYQ